MAQPTFAFAAAPVDLQDPNLFINVSGDYSYLGDGYYRSMEAAHEGKVALPTPADALDAYVVPLALVKAKAAGIAVPEWEVVNDDTISFKPPILAYPVNPFQSQGVLISDEASADEAIRSITMVGKYAAVIQNMPTDSRVDTMRVIIGKCLKPEYADFAQEVWRAFRIPVARVKVIVTETAYLFSAIEPLPREELTQNEKAILKEAGLWRT